MKQIEPANGANQNISGSAPTKVLTRKDAAAEAGLSRDQMHTALRVANVPSQQFEALVESDQPPSVTKLAELGIVPKACTAVAVCSTFRKFAGSSIAPTLSRDVVKPHLGVN